jgi:NAD(P) transhydrogenase subunit alpha
MFSKNVVAFVRNLVKDGQLHLDLEDEITRGSLVTRDGRVVNEAVRARLA